MKSISVQEPSQLSGARAFFLILVVSWLTFFAFFPGLFFTAGINRVRHEVAPGRVVDVWFPDSFAILASSDAVAAGHDPYAPNPLDYLHRPHVYGPWWLRLHDVGLTRADNLYVGLALGSAFLAATVIWLRPRDLRTSLGYFAIVGSIPVLLALERANNDLVIFLVLTPVVPCLLARAVAVRWLAVGFVAVAADLKFYPGIAVLVLLAAAPPRELRWRIAIGAALLALVGWHVGGDLSRIVHLLPPAEGVFTFSAVGGFHELGWAGPWPLLLAIGLGAAILVGCWRKRSLGSWTPAVAQRSEWMHFVLGAALLTACFLSGQNYAYRWIFALWLAPFLWSIPADLTATSEVRRLAFATRWLLLVVLWFDPACTFMLSHLPGLDLVRALHWVYLIEQPITWAFFACLLVFIAHFTRESLRALLGPETESAS